MAEDTIFLPALLSAEFGVSPTEAQKRIRASDVRIDDEPYTPENSDEKIWIPKDRVVGKRVFVNGEAQSYNILVHDPDEDE